jgi:hypothetical protein
MGIQSTVVGSYPIGKWEPYLKAGVFLADTELTVSGDLAGTPLEARLSGPSSDGFYGLGVGYNISDRWQLKLDAAHFVAAGERKSAHADIIFGSLGFTYRF